MQKLNITEIRRIDKERRESIEKLIAEEIKHFSRNKSTYNAGFNISRNMHLVDYSNESEEDDSVSPTYEQLFENSGFSTEKRPLENALGVIFNEKMNYLYPKITTNWDRNKLERVNSEIWNSYEKNRQKMWDFARKCKAKLRIMNVLQTMFPDDKLEVFCTGSTINGCCSVNSDLDISVSISNLNKIKKYIDVLFKLKKRLIQQRSELEIVFGSVEVTRAKIPIVKLKMFHRSKNPLSIDISLNNYHGVRNSCLLSAYSSIDLRLPAIVNILKLWAAKNNILSSVNGYLNSYTLVLMTIHLFQSAVNPPILPNLQHIYSDYFHKFEESEFELFGKIQNLPEMEENHMSVGELLRLWFTYYDNLRLHKIEIDIKRGTLYKCKQYPFEERSLIVDDPINGENTARCAIKMNEIEEAVSDAATRCMKGNFCLADIGISV